MKGRIANYLQTFECIGSRCEDTCCAHFGLYAVDKGSYENLIQIHSQKPLWPENAPTLLKRPEPTDLHYADIVVKEDGFCPFLTAEQLCHIHREHGHAALPQSCQRFPRIDVLVGNTWERTATLSCPEAARLALLSEEPLTLQQTTASPPETFHRRLEFQSKEEEQLFEKVRDATRTILQTQNLSPAERLVFLALFIEKTIPPPPEKPPPGAAEALLAELETPSLAAHIRGLPILHELPLALITQLFQEGLLSDSTPPRYRSFCEETIAGLQIDDGGGAPLLSRFREGYLHYLKPLEEKYPQIWENYLLNLMYQTLFPFGLYRTPQEATLVLSLRFALVRTQLIGIALSRGHLDIETLVAFVQAFSKMFEHNDERLVVLADYLCEKNLNSTAHLATLVRL